VDVFDSSGLCLFFQLPFLVLKHLARLAYSSMYSSLMVLMICSKQLDMINGPSQVCALDMVIFRCSGVGGDPAIWVP